MALHPDQKLKCLLIHPKFSAFSFWNYVDAAKTIGAKTPSPPLGLITLAAILPQHWEYRLLDLNAQDFSESDWSWADIICVGGMLPQQKGILDIISRANREKKFVAVGGSDPSSQPSIYSDADALVVGEGESAVPVWLESWRAGKSSGVFKETGKPDVSLSPCPRYDLLNLNFYVQIGVQYSRGCPFNCEFCDIIELFGRKPRTKTPGQILHELTVIKKLGYSGSIDIVDDNFIGNKRDVKRNLLPALIEWNRAAGHPFYYCTEASMNMADDIKLMELMQEADFRVIFMGIETPDPELLLKTQKSQNTVKPIVDRVQTLYKYGMVTTAGFIMGFDGEKRGMDQSMIRLIEDTSINMAMVGLLVALPNTQLTRRLLKENRLLSFSGERVSSESELRQSARDSNTVVEVVDQTVAGLNFITTRDRVEILKEYKNVVAEVYNARKYFDRALRVGDLLVCKSKHVPRLFQLRRHLRGFIQTSWQMTIDSETRYLYWRNFFKMLPKGRTALEQVMRLMGIYLHFKKQTKFLAKAMEAQIESQSRMPADMRMVPVALVVAVAVEENNDALKTS